MSTTITSEEWFPTKEYSSAVGKWLGTSLIVTPSLQLVLGDSLFGQTVLDVGCGNGSHSEDFLRWGAAKVVGIDSSHEMVLKAKLKFSNNKALEFREKSSLELQDVNLYDSALAIFVLQFSANVNELQTSLANIARSLKPGGQLVGFVPNGVGDLNPCKANGVKFGATIVLNTVPPEDGEHLQVDFYGGDGEVIGHTTVTFFYRSTYETCLKRAGFTEIEWIEPVVSEEGRAKFGSDFFDTFFHPPKDILFRARVPMEKENQ